jgi:uncharacterized protein (TIGR03000 family)
MYSLVLMMAMSGGVEAPAGHGDCCGGGWGCCGGWSCGGGCSGGYGCCGGGCHGCHGGGGHGCHGGGHSLFGGHHHNSCSGCCGGGYGCCGGGYGCCGGGYGCYGGGYGCYGGGYGCYGGGYGCNGGGYGCAGGMMVAPAAPAATTPATPPPDGAKPMDDMPKPKPKTGGTDGANIAAPATIHVSLPADAKLMIDDFTTKSTSAARVFVSPELAPGQVFHYNLKAEIVRDGQTLSVTEQVAVRAGAETRVSFAADKFVSSSVAQK